MIPIVYLTGEHRELHGHEGMDINPGIPHLLEEGMTNMPACHVIVNQPDLDSFLCLVHQCIGNQTPQGVILEDEHVDMDMVLCFPYL